MNYLNTANVETSIAAAYASQGASVSSNEESQDRIQPWQLKKSVERRIDVIAPLEDERYQAIAWAQFVVSLAEDCHNDLPVADAIQLFLLSSEVPADVKDMFLAELNICDGVGVKRFDKFLHGLIDRAGESYFDRKMVDAWIAKAIRSDALRRKVGERFLAEVGQVDVIMATLVREALGQIKPERQRNELVRRGPFRKAKTPEQKAAAAKQRRDNLQDRAKKNRERAKRAS